MANYRQDRVNEDIARSMSEILRGIKDPRISGEFISITKVDFTANLRSCKLYYSVLGSEETAANVAEGLKRAMGYIRSQLAQRLNLRITPELRFIYDHSIVVGADITKMIHGISEELAIADERDLLEAEAPANAAETEHDEDDFDEEDMDFDEDDFTKDDNEDDEEESDGGDEGEDE